MGTNYYIRQNYCSHCERKDMLHIGKSSCGWKFLFNSNDEFTTYEELKFFLDHTDEPIFDEYGREISREDFFNKVESKQGDKPHSDVRCFIDDDGYDFCTAVFS